MLFAGLIHGVMDGRISFKSWLTVPPSHFLYLIICRWTPWDLCVFILACRASVSMKRWVSPWEVGKISVGGYPQNRIVEVYDGSTVDFLRSLQALFPDSSANLILFICNVKLIPLLLEGPFVQHLNKASVHSACVQVLKIINFVVGDFCVSSWLY